MLSRLPLRLCLPQSACVMLMALLPLCVARAELVRGDDARLQYEGRVRTDGSGVCRIGFPGVFLRLQGEFSVLSLECQAGREDGYLDVSVDGGAFERVRLREGVQTLTLFQGEPGPHRVQVCRRTESWQGVLEIRSVDTQNGWLGVPDPLPKRRLLFIGDSITCGAGADVREGDPASGFQLSNGRLAFGRLLASRLHAQCHLVSYGGRGVIRDWQGIRDTANAPQFYERCLPDDPHSRWDPACWVPDAVGVCLGTNDFNQGVPDENEFVNAYVEFIRKIRRDAPRAVILLLDSPMVEDSPDKGPRRSVLSHYIDSVVARLDDPGIRHLPLSHYAGRAGDGHPVAAEHQRIADEIEVPLRRALGW